MYFKCSWEYFNKASNRAGNSVVVNMSKVKMHVRDEHVRGHETKNRLKRRFEADGAAQKSAQMSSEHTISRHVPPVDEVIDGW